MTQTASTTDDDDGAQHSNHDDDKQAELSQMVEDAVDAIKERDDMSVHWASTSDNACTVIRADADADGYDGVPIDVDIISLNAKDDGYLVAGSPRGATYSNVAGRGYTLDTAMDIITDTFDYLD
jgi:hypothetical protein